MKNRFGWMLAPAVLGAFLIFAQPAVAQVAGPDVGQQGEFNGEHADTGAAALDTGPETAEPVEATASLKASPSAVRTTVTSPLVAGPSAATALAPGSEQDLNVEGDFDLQEIGGPDTPGAN